MTGAWVSQGDAREVSREVLPQEEVSAPSGFTRVCLEPCCDISELNTARK